MQPTNYPDPKKVKTPQDCICSVFGKVAMKKMPNDSLVLSLFAMQIFRTATQYSFLPDKS